MHHWNRIVPLSLVVLAVAAGCKAAPAKPAGFVDSSRMTKQKDLPFHLAWRNEKAAFANYDKVYIAPVDTSHLLEMDWWKKGEVGAMENFKKDLDKIALEHRATMREMFQKPPEGVKNRFLVVDQPGGDKTLTLSIAIVEIVPSKVALTAASWAMPFGTGVLLTPLNTSTAAMEGNFKDSRSGDVILSFADREGEQARPVNLASFTWYTHAKGILKDWAKQFVEIANQKPGEVVKDTKVFTMKPW